MKQLTVFLMYVFVFCFFSCSQCEDRTLKVNPDLLSWLPYESDTSLSFSDSDGQSLSFELSPDVTTRIKDDDGCTTTSIQPYVILSGESEPEFLQLWFQRQEDLLADNDQLWGIHQQDGLIAGSGAITNIIDADLIAGSVMLQGRELADVISLELQSNGSNTLTAYLQKDVGLVGLTYDGIDWLLEQ